MTTSPEQISQKPFIITRLLDAQREIVFKTWTEADHMEWWGPKGVTVGHAKLDLRPGGLFHYSMRTAYGPAMWGRWSIREVVPPERLVFVNSFSDESGGITRHPLSASWPLEVLSTITFAEELGKTLLTINWLPLNPTEEERKTFDAGHDSMRGGWTGSLERLEEYLATLRKSKIQ